MAHERVDADAEEVRDAHYVGYNGGRVSLHALGQPDAGQDNHGAKGQPPHQGCQHLKVLGLGHVEEPEGPDHGDENRQHDSEKNLRLKWRDGRQTDSCPSDPGSIPLGKNNENEREAG